MTDNILYANVAASPVKGSYASVNGINLYYEIHGPRDTGTPLIMLHGGLSVIGMFAPVLGALSSTRQVIGVELQAHGHTADIDRPLSFEAMADDINGLIEHLHLQNADFFGYSLGGGVAWQMAIRHPKAVRKLVTLSAPGRRNGWYPEVLAGMAMMNAEIARTWIGSPMQQAFAQVAPRPEDWPVLVEKTAQLLKQDYDWTQEIAQIKAPTMIIIGDADSVRTAHAVELFGLLGGGKQDAGLDGSGIPTARLGILPGATHYNILYSPLLMPALTSFFEAPMPEVK